MKKVIIVDDERSGRDLIKQYLVDFKQLILVAEANNGVDAIKVINEFNPDLIFLDIQMPGLTGFEVLRHINEIPQIIFSTAYDKYALEAFEVHAVDYLLKPYTKERFNKAVERLEVEREVNNITPLAESLIKDKPTFPEQILVNKNRKLITLPVSSIIWIEAYGDYAKLHTAQDVYISNYGITTMEEKLNPRSFLRVHRSAIINLQQVKELERYAKSYDVLMKNGAVVRVSRGYMDKLKEIIF